MKLRATDQLHISAVKADSLRPGEEFEVNDAAGEDLLRAHASRLVKIEDGADAPAEKAEAPPQNKAEDAAPANKAAPKRSKGR